MKMIYGGTPVNSMKVRHYEVNTNGATTVPSAVQAGLTYFANGRQEVGTGKCFSFASYGGWMTNESNFIPMDINTVQIGSMDYPVRTTLSMTNSHLYDFTTPQNVGEVIVDGMAYPLTVSVQNGEFLVTCEKTINIELFIGKDEYIL